MLCIFCKENSDYCISKEHIIPESLGNEEHILPPGWVCDKCNNYLSREVEAPFLNTEYGKRSRFEMVIPSKKGRIPIVTGLHPRSRTLIDFMHGGKSLSFCASNATEQANFINSIQTQTRGSFYIPMAGDPKCSYETSRFIGMVAIEILAQRGIDITGWNDEIVNKPELDELRNYVRFGKKGFVWPVHTRRLYPADFVFSDPDTPEFQVLHEWDILVIPEPNENLSGEFYVVIAILGVEYTINLGGPELDGYLDWLQKNNSQSYLYSKK